jgi:hypothetical protein
VDEFSEFSGADKRALLELERKLIEKSDCVSFSHPIVCSRPNAGTIRRRFS